MSAFFAWLDAVTVPAWAIALVWLGLAIVAVRLAHRARPAEPSWNGHRRDEPDPIEGPALPEIPRPRHDYYPPAVQMVRDYERRRREDLEALAARDAADAADRAWAASHFLTSMGWTDKLRSSEIEQR